MYLVPPSSHATIFIKLLFQKTSQVYFHSQFFNTFHNFVEVACFAFAPLKVDTHTHIIPQEQFQFCSILFCRLFFSFVWFLLLKKCRKKFCISKYWLWFCINYDTYVKKVSAVQLSNTYFILMGLFLIHNRTLQGH